MDGNKQLGIFIVIPVYNRKVHTLGCLEALARQTVRDFHVVVVDDGSSDGTAAAIAVHFPGITVLHGDGNLWWSGATNLGVEYALAHGADYILTLNDDTLPQPDYMGKMLREAAAEPRALLGSLALNAQGDIEYGGQRICWWSAGYVNLVDRLPPAQRRGLHAVTHFPGRGLWVPAEVFRTVGLYAADIFPQAVADDDFTHRASKAGYKIFCNYEARLINCAGVSRSELIRHHKSWANYRAYLFQRSGAGNLYYFVRYALRNCPPWWLPLYLPIGLLRRVGGYLLEWGGEWLGCSSKNKLFKLGPR